MGRRRSTVRLMDSIQVEHQPAAVIALLGRVGPHYPDQAADWIILLRDGSGNAVADISIGVTHSRHSDPAVLQDMIAKAEIILEDSGYRLQPRGPYPNTWAAAWAIGDTSDVIDVEAID